MSQEDREVDEALALVSRATEARGPAAQAHAPHAAGPGAEPDRGGGETGGTGPAATSSAPPARTRATPWREARAVAARAGGEGAPRTRRVALAQALGQVLAEPLRALTDLPSFDTSAMDGWAVAGPGPWWSVGQGGQVLAGHAAPGALAEGAAVRIATGARVPPDATAVIRSEHARLDEAQARLYARREVVQGQDIRPRGQECRTGDQLLPAGALVSPAVLGLAAAAGYDELDVVPRPRVEVLVLGDELLDEGLPHDGMVRDALGPLLAPWLRALGAEVLATRHLGDDADALHRAVTASEADLVVTTGGTAAGPVDHVHPILRRAGAELLVDGVAVRPGHPMLLARLGGGAEGRYLVGLPGNPLAAVSGLLTLAEPLLRARAQRPALAPYSSPVRDAVNGHPHDTRLVPVVHRAGGADGNGPEQAVPLHYNGPAMLRGVAAADALAVVPPGGARAGQDLDILELPWTEGRFT
ncbi:molybdopterin molybdotransferase MoeA [Streptomyces chryseus]|uniref:molybdopterin molybdotransferase MoeA n=2 Tax=Streptomyces chryseus TaxID=68186 RepID=UPI001FCB1FFD|nr:molybdopterin molybdotransferase MoeA [Streptomyces chryseus]